MGVLEANLAKLKEDLKEHEKYFYRGRNMSKEKKRCALCETGFGDTEYKGKNICTKCMNALKGLV